jgi:hypothetical protein
MWKEGLFQDGLVYLGVLIGAAFSLRIPIQIGTAKLAHACQAKLQIHHVKRGLYLLSCM